MIDNSEGKKNFEELYNKYKNLMLNRAYDIIKDSGLAEDAVHNAFLNILNTGYESFPKINIKNRKDIIQKANNILSMKKIYKDNRKNYYLRKLQYKKARPILPVGSKDTPQKQKPELSKFFFYSESKE